MRTIVTIILTNRDVRYKLNMNVAVIIMYVCQTMLWHSLELVADLGVTFSVMIVAS